MRLNKKGKRRKLQPLRLRERKRRKRRQLQPPQQKPKERKKRKNRLLQQRLKH